MSVLSFSHVTFSHTTEPLLSDLSLSVGAGERVCLVGPNGAGKTTLLRLAAGDLSPEYGTITSAVTTATAADTVGELLADATRTDRLLQQRFEALTADLTDDPTGKQAAEYDRVLAEMTARDVWSLAARVETLLAGLGLAGLDHDRAMAALSPGQQGRLTLVALLLTNPEQLVLDEPTNHLDDAARDFLIGFLRDFSGPVLFASHDRDFIERTATSMADLDTAPWEAVALADDARPPTGVHKQAGTYSDFLVTKAIARQRHLDLHAAQQAEKRSLNRHRREADSAFRKFDPAKVENKITKKFYGDRIAKVTSQRKTADERKLAALEAREIRKPRETLYDFAFPPATHVAPIAVRIRGRVELDLAGGEKLLVNGPNGAGKSTLLRQIAASTSAGFLPQELPADGEPIGEPGKGFLHPKFFDVPVRLLSDGNRRRTQLARLAAQAPDVLIVDEPTNYLDLEAIEGVEKALREWNGTVILATHDRWLIEHFEGRRVELG